uniref:SUMO-activating enzyme subunit n=1 Tax=Plectus sambesii TaxID=2011161 RepID=A0A914X6L2_9BILA
MPALPKELLEKVAATKVLVVGAGGIGCELLKNLVLTGFADIEVIDLDIIDVSNLNRQFLFHKQHVGKSKAAVATESVLSFCPTANIKHHHNSIMSPEFGVSFFKQFSLVLNALDNRAARNHVNRLCLAAEVPLVESGSAGYLGQVSVIKRGVTECYECTPKPAARSYPGCTIRNTPSEPIHCIVWAKHLFNQLFGEADIDEDVSPDMADPEAQQKNGQEDGAVDQPAANGDAPQTNNSSSNAERMSTRKWAIDNNYDPKTLFNKLFNEDIRYLLSMSNLWKKRTPPIALNYDSLPDEHPGSSSSSSASSARGHAGSGIKDQVVWTPMTCRDEFDHAVATLRDQLSKKEDGHVLVWDKDDETAVHFVTACANLRAYVFGIPLKSLFDVKSMAGNIIPAIATTNACVAGMIVMEALKIVDGRIDATRSVFISRLPNPRGKILVDQIPDKPNPKCYVCSEKSEVFVKLNTNAFTVKQLEDKILKQTLNMVAPDVELADGSGTIIISSEEGETTALQDKTLAELKVVDGSRLQCDDYMQNFELSLIIIHCQDFKDGIDFVIITDIADLKPKEADEEMPKEEEDVECVVASEVMPPETVGLKKRRTADSDGPDTKRARISDQMGD